MPGGLLLPTSTVACRPLPLLPSLLPRVLLALLLPQAALPSQVPP